MRFGIAGCDIVPPFTTSMGGYGKRDDHFQGINDPLIATFVLLEANGKRVLIGAIDLVTLPSDGRLPRWLDRLSKASGAPRDHILLNVQHTHGGPKLPGSSAFARSQGDQQAAARYADWLEDRLIDAARAAASDMQEGTLWYTEGPTSLPMNRRLLRDGRIVHAPNPAGPIDDHMQVLMIKDAAGKLRALGMRISCHPVATGPQMLLTADYVGAWRAAFADEFGPRVTPFFLQGAGGDMRPRHVADGDRWRVMPHDELPAVGRDVCNEMLDAIQRRPPTELKGLDFRGIVHTARVPCEHKYTARETIEPLHDSKDYLERDFAEDCLAKLDRGEAIPDHAEYQVQTIWLSSDFAIVGLQCEPLIALGRAVERALAPATTMVLGYVNGCVSYAPDSTELARGGYEAESYLMAPWTGPWKEGLEKSFIPAIAPFDPA